MSILGLRRQDSPAGPLSIRPHRLVVAIDKFFLVNERRLGWLDGFRVLAVCLALAFHIVTGPYLRQVGVTAASYTTSMLAGIGWIGVPLFFVISGFLVGGSVILSARRDTFDAWHFFLRRVVRTVPPAIVLILAVQFYFGQIKVDPVLFYNLLFVSNYTGQPYMGHLWSLCVEEHFYLALCLLVGLFGARLRDLDLGQASSVLFLAAIGFALIKLAAGPAMGVASGSLYVDTHWQLDFFMTGLALRLKFEMREEAGARVWHSALLSALVLALCCSVFVGCAYVLSTATSQDDVKWPGALLAKDMQAIAIVVSLPITAMIVGCGSLNISPLQDWLGARPLRWIAGMSYSIYLVHIVVLNYPLFTLAPDGHIAFLSANSSFYFVELYLAEFGFCLMTALVFFALVERPMLLLRRRLIRQPTHRTANEPA